MAEPVKIVITEERRGNAVEEEKRRLEELNRTAGKTPPAPKPQAAPRSTPQAVPQSPASQPAMAPASQPATQAAAQHPATPSPQDEIARLHAAAEHYQGQGNETAAKSARNDAFDLQRKELASALSKEASFRATGNVQAADAMAREAKEMEKVLGLQKKFGVGYQEAMGTARTQMATEHYAPAAKIARSDSLDSQREQIAAALSREAGFRATGNTGAADAVGREVWQMQRALSLQTRLNMGYTEAVTLARQELATREQELAVKEEEAAIKGAGINPLGGSSGLRGGRFGQIGQFMGNGLRNSGEAGFAVTMGLMFQHAIDAQTEALRGLVAQTRDQGYEVDQQERHRDRALASVNGPAAEFAMEAGMQDESQQQEKEIEDKQDQIDKLETGKVQRTASWGAIGGVIGAMGGALIGNPLLGAALGSALGVGAGALYNKTFVNPQEDQMNAQQGLDSGEKRIIDQERNKLEERRKADMQDEVSMAEAEARHDFSSIRRIKEKIEWMKRYHEAKGAGATEQQAQELANLGTYQDRRKVAERMGAALMTARTGAAEAAAVARIMDNWMKGPDSSHGDKIDSMHHTLRTGLSRLNQSQVIQDPNE